MSNLAVHHVRSIYVADLFGQFTYQLPGNGRELLDFNILYALNGAGKTTVLTLLFHMLSPGNRHSHRTAISEIPFSECRVTLRDGTVISATKNKQLLAGPVTFAIESKTIAPARWTFLPERTAEPSPFPFLPPDVDVQAVPKEYREEVKREIQERSFHSSLKSLQVNIFMLTCDRLLMADTLRDARTSEARPDTMRRRGPPGIQVAELRNTSVQEALDRAREWVEKKFLQRNYTSQAGLDPYTEIVRKIAGTKSMTRTGIDKNQDVEIREKLKSRIVTIDSRAKELHELGIGLTSVSLELVDVMKKSSGNKLQLMSNILEPHLNGLQARQDNVYPLYLQVRRFLDAINRFFKGKRVVYSISDGFRIMVAADSGPERDLTAGKLSSGEQQLLLLFCSILVAQDTPAVFIIDEPELSLNVTWQRMLVSALQDLASAAQVQFVFASHSLEVIARHRESVVQLVKEQHV